jgi:hypothetical protein
MQIVVIKMFEIDPKDIACTTLVIDKKSDVPQEIARS